jgi:hypothetical protein
MPHTESTTDIPDKSTANDVAAGYWANVPAPTKVEKTEQADGKWTVIATLPNDGPDASRSYP